MKLSNKPCVDCTATTREWQCSGDPKWKVVCERCGRHGEGDTKQQARYNFTHQVQWTSPDMRT